MARLHPRQDDAACLMDGGRRSVGAVSVGWRGSIVVVWVMDAALPQQSD
jgi:hypothetical protein